MSANAMKKLSLCLVSALAPISASAQQVVPDFLTEYSTPPGEGWSGFLDFAFMGNLLLTLTLATVLGAVLAYHPKLLETADTLEEIDARKVCVLYSVIGALIGIIVFKYGLVVGFVLFGIGGLIRFRTIMSSAVMTGQVIFITLIGLACGLDLPHVGVLATAFGYGLIYLVDAQITYRAEIRGIPAEKFPEAAAAYRAALVSLGCKIIRERKNPEKQRLGFLILGGQFESAGEIEKAIDAAVDPTLRGSIDWEIN